MVEQESLEEIELPDFIQLHLHEKIEDKTSSLFFESTSFSDVGEYQVRVYSQLDNYYQNMTQIDFKVVVYQPTDIDWSL